MNGENVKGKVIVGLLAVLGCGGTYFLVNHESRRVAVQKEFQYSFERFGNYALRIDGYDSSVTSADIDGDGDVDLIVVSNMSGHQALHIIENKMPQKGGLEKKLDK